MRTCIGCRRRATPERLVRVVASGGELLVGQGLPGRGAWLCRDSPACFEAARRRKAFARALRVEVREEAIDRLQPRAADRARMV